MESSGKCLVCHVVGQGRKDFVCEKCFELAKNGPIFACHGCKKSGPVPAEGVALLEKRLMRPLNRPGIVIVSNVCSDCLEDKPGIAPEFEVHSIRALADRN